MNENTPVTPPDKAEEYSASKITVLEGLEAEEKVITSGYDNFGDNEVLVF